jgi:hypothetical protein
MRTVEENADILNSLRLNTPGYPPLARPDNKLEELRRRQQRFLPVSRSSFSLNKEGSQFGSKRFETATPSIDSAKLRVASPSLDKEGSQSGNKTFETATPSIDSAKLEVASPSLDKEGSQSGNETFETATPSIDSENLEDASLSLDEEFTIDMSSIDPEELEEETASSTVEAPEFTGPEPISETINFGILQYHPFANGHVSVEVSESPAYRLNPNLIDSLVGGDYSEYPYSSSIYNSTLPTTLAAVNMAEAALSRQPDYNSERKGAIEIVKAAVEIKFGDKLSDSDDIRLTPLAVGLIE